MPFFRSVARGKKRLDICLLLNTIKLKLWLAVSPGQPGYIPLRIQSQCRSERPLAQYATQRKKVSPRAFRAVSTTQNKQELSSSFLQEAELQKGVHWCTAPGLPQSIWQLHLAPPCHCQVAIFLHLELFRDVVETQTPWHAQKPLPFKPGLFASNYYAHFPLRTNSAHTRVRRHSPLRLPEQARAGWYWLEPAGTSQNQTEPSRTCRNWLELPAAGHTWHRTAPASPHSGPCGWCLGTSSRHREQLCLQTKNGRNLPHILKILEKLTTNSGFWRFSNKLRSQAWALTLQIAPFCIIANSVTCRWPFQYRPSV